MPLARHHYDVSLVSHGDGQADGRGPVGLHDDPRPLRLADGEYPAQHFREYRQGILRAGVVTGQDGQVGKAGGGGAHQRPLCAVPVTAAAQHDGQAAAGHRAQRAQYRFHRSRLVRIVNEHGEILASVNSLQPSRDAGAGRDPGHRGGQVHASLDQRSNRAERVGDVVGPGEGHAGVGLDPAGADDPERAAVRPAAHVGGPPVGVRVAAGGERDNGDARAVGEAPAVGVVDVHHPDPRVAGREQQGLRGVVLLQVAVEVQVVLGQVGEDGHLVEGARHPAQREGVAGHLHRGRGDAAVDHRREEGLEVGRLRGGELARRGLPRDPRLHPADQAGQVPGAAQRGFQQVAGGGLAAGPGHADQQQPGRGVTVDPGCHLAEPGPGVGNDKDGHAAVPRGLPAGRVGEHGNRPG